VGHIAPCFAALAGFLTSARVSAQGVTDPARPARDLAVIARPHREGNSAQKGKRKSGPILCCPAGIH